MALARGSRIGAYDIVGPLGAGGMGEVYRARDSRLNRDVAMKLRPESFAGDPGKWIAQASSDGVTTNIWALSTESGEWCQITDFGGRPTFIARRVYWSSDGRSIFAAVAEGDADVVLLDGLDD